jgi:hypothetical protein
MAADKGQSNRVVFMTDDAQRKWLDEHSAATGAPIGEIIRRAIAAYQEMLRKKTR